MWVKIPRQVGLYMVLSGVQDGVGCTLLLRHVVHGRSHAVFRAREAVRLIIFVHTKIKIFVVACAFGLALFRLLFPNYELNNGSSGMGALPRCCCMTGWICNWIQDRGYYHVN